MSISPISASSLYQEQINYILNVNRTDYTSVSNLLARFGVKSTGDEQKDLAKLKEVQVKTAVEGLQSLSEEDESSKSQSKPASYIWYSVMYQLGLNPTGDPEKDFTEIMECLVEKVENSRDINEYNKYMGLIDIVETLFISSGVRISDLGADSVSVFSSMQLLAGYNKAKIEKT